MSIQESQLKGLSFFLNSINEYEGRVLPCSNDNVAVTVVGTTGECPLSGDEVIAGLGIHGVTDNFWFNVAMLIGLQAVFRVAAYVLLRRSR
jgi:hypothetical protein